MSEHEITTILGPGSSFDGKLTFEGAVRIDGRFSGEIDTDGTLVIGSSADVEARIRAAKVVVEGRVRGDIAAAHELEIRASAHVHGNVRAPSLAVERGAILQGECRMEDLDVAGADDGADGGEAQPAHAADAG